jgi:hypothetical protein
MWIVRPSCTPRNENSGEEFTIVPALLNLS